MKVQASLVYTRTQQIGKGQGRNSIVYAIDEQQLGGVMVAKEVDKTQFRPAQDYFAEAKVMFSNAHENVVPIQYACETPTHVCMVMPYFANGSLADRIKDGPLSVRETIRVGIGIADALARIHTAGFIHFDIKPTNVLFSNVGVPLLADFGQTRAISPAGLSAIPPVYETCVAPEWYSGAVATIHWDLYQVGLLLYRAVNGEPLYRPQEFYCSEATICNGKFPNRDLFLPHVPRKLKTIIRKALHVDPAQRHQSATELSRELGRVNVGHDWQVVMTPDKDVTWTAQRPGQPDLVVEKRLDQRTKKWVVGVFTHGAAGQRAKDPGQFYRVGLTDDEADRHLKSVFGTLG